MTMLVVDGLFLDTNVLVQATQVTAPLHQVTRAAVAAAFARGRELWISRQVLREYLAVLSRPQTYTAPLDAATLARRVQQFEAQFAVADDDARVTAQLVALLQRFPTGGRQVHDANIVATMVVYGVPQLLTHNTDDFVRFAGLITVQPVLPPLP